jgi:hypothetical protein
MPDQKEMSLFSQTLEKTSLRRISWQPTAQKDTFAAAVGGQFTLLVFLYDKDPETGEKGTSFLLKDKAGEIVAKVTDRDAGDDIEELYYEARRQALQLDEQLDNALDLMKKL